MKRGRALENQEKGLQKRRAKVLTSLSCDQLLGSCDLGSLSLVPRPGSGDETRVTGMWYMMCYCRRGGGGGERD